MNDDLLFAAHRMLPTVAGTLFVLGPSRIDRCRNYSQDAFSPVRPTTGESRLKAYEERIRDLEKLLAEEKAKASLAEVAHLQAVVKWFATSDVRFLFVECCSTCFSPAPGSVSAERESAEMKAEMAEMRAEMSSVAAEMAQGLG